MRRGQCHTEGGKIAVTSAAHVDNIDGINRDMGNFARAVADADTLRAAGHNNGVRIAIFERPAYCAFNLLIGPASKPGELGQFLRVWLNPVDHAVGPPVTPLWVDQYDRVIAVCQRPARTHRLCIDHALVVVGNQNDIDL